MSETVSPRAVAGLWAALQKAPMVATGRGAAEIQQRAIASGWAGYTRVESLILASDPRLLSLDALTIRELLAAFEIPLQWTFRRPRKGETGGLGVEMVAAMDLAHLLIQLEATGFLVDPVPLCEALRPQLRTREHLTGAEIAVWWHPKEQHRSAPKILATGPRETWGRRAEDLITPDGYCVDLYRGPDDAPSAITVTAPKWRSHRRSAAA